MTNFRQTNERTDAPAPAAGRTEFAVTGMTCGNCARHVAEAIQSVAGVRSATVHLGQNRASVRWGAGAGANPAAVIQAVVAAGFEASVLEPSCAGENHTETKLAGWQLTLWI